MEHRKHFDHRVTAASLVIALGIIYGDIGTSPLYVFKAIIGEKIISRTLVFGGVSCVFWTLVFQTSIKYVWLTLKADNEGEGGIFSLYSLVRRYGKRLVVPTMIGACALLADGIITPAVSVTSSIEGLTLLQGFEGIHVVPIVIAIISFIFLFQRLGTEKVGKVFGPLMILWFSLLLSIGLFQILKYPTVISALNPKYALELLIHYPHGFWILGAVFLCTTGAEALYSDMGHCGKRNIRITWLFVKICLVANYLGQAAWLMHQGDLYLEGRNPFFKMMPEWFLIPGIIIATMAASVASQSLISGSYTLINEAINLNFWQKTAVKRPTDAKGQIYIPSVNTILWLGCILIVLYFQTSSRMEAAYGLAITVAMMMTTYLLMFFLLYKLKWNRILVFFLLFLFASIEISFFVANIVKFKDGGYITVLVGGLFFFVMYVTYFSKKITTRYTKFVEIRKHVPLLQELSDDETIPKFATHLIYLTKSNRKEQVELRIIQSILAQKPKRADVYWFFHLNRTDQPYTLNYEVVEIEKSKIFKIILNIGFRIQPRTELYFKQILHDLIDNKEFGLDLLEDTSFKYSKTYDFRFILLERYVSVENEFSFRDGLIIKSYYMLKKLAEKDEKAFGLDKSDVIVEQIPFVYQPLHQLTLTRK